MPGSGDRPYSTMPGEETELAVRRNENEPTQFRTPIRAPIRTEDARRPSDGPVSLAANFSLIGVALTLKCVRDPQDLPGVEDFFR